jgi:hypothetical protein
LEIAEQSPTGTATRPSRFGAIFRNEDWLSIWIGLGLIAVAAVVFAAGGSIKWLAVAPQKWSHWSDVAAQIEKNGARFAALLVVWSILFGAGAGALGIGVRRFLPAFLVIFIVASAVYFLGLWDQ